MLPVPLAGWKWFFLKWTQCQLFKPYFQSSAGNVKSDDHLSICGEVSSFLKCILKRCEIAQPRLWNCTANFLVIVAPSLITESFCFNGRKRLPIYVFFHRHSFCSHCVKTHSDNGVSSGEKAVLLLLSLLPRDHYVLAMSTFDKL